MLQEVEKVFVAKKFLNGFAALSNGCLKQILSCWPSVAGVFFTFILHDNQANIRK